MSFGSAMTPSTRSAAGSRTRPWKSRPQARPALPGAQAAGVGIRADHRLRAHQAAGLGDAGDPYGEGRKRLAPLKRPSGASMTSTTPKWAPRPSPSSPMTSRIPPCPQRSTGSGAPSGAGDTRSPTGTPPKSPNAATEAANNLVKRVKRAAFQFTNLDNYRIRALLYAGRPNWSLLDIRTPT